MTDPDTPLPRVPGPSGSLTRDRLYHLLATGHIALPPLVQALAVAEQLNFHRVAETLGISQSMISLDL